MGQAIIFAQQTESVIAKSGFESILMTSKSGDITFTNETEQKVFETNVVPIKIKVTAVEGKTLSTTIAYKVGDGENPDFNKIPANELKIPSGKTEYTFEKDINFTEGLSANQFWLWAQCIDENNNTAGSSYIIITVNTQGGSSSKVVLESPDPFTKLATTDPIIQTSKFSINVSTATIYLWEGDADHTTDTNLLYTVNVTSGSSVFVSSTSCISYLNSTVMDGKKLESGKTYTLKIDFASDVYEDIDLEFTAISGGVANILTYPSPFNPNKEKIKIRYLLAKTSNVTIRLYDKAGKVVCKLVDGEERSAGTNEEEWDGRNYAGETLATGAYIVEIIAGSDRRYTALAIVGK